MPPLPLYLNPNKDRPAQRPGKGYIMATTNNILAAFNQIVESPVPCSKFYVVLWVNCPYYGGPEEGGWWGNDRIPQAFTECASECQANALRDRIEVLAKSLSSEASRDHGRTCLSQLAYCEARGIDDSNSVYGETDGEDSYDVTVQAEPPSARYGDRHYS